MAMKYREPNRARWVGTRPGHDGVQVAVGKTCLNIVDVVYTVPAGKVFYLVQWTFGLYTAAAGNISMYIRNDAAVFQRYLGYAAVSAGATIPPSQGLASPPIEMTAAWDIVLIGSGVGVGAVGDIFGWVENA